jgi:hypothetical protein
MSVEVYESINWWVVVEPGAFKMPLGLGRTPAEAKSSCIVERERKEPGSSAATLAAFDREELRVVRVALRVAWMLPPAAIPDLAWLDFEEGTDICTEADVASLLGMLSFKKETR